MRVFRLFGSAAVLALPLSAVPAVAQAQVQPLNPLGDELAAEMRLLAANPLDINALVRAGELALKLGDPTAAATFFARAERLDPRNARIKAGTGSLLVQAERPGEALRRFGEAEALGLDPRAYAADRGLAYDLIGQQERAQRDYRLALKDGPADETIRRYALSLGISGKRDMALQQLDPLVRRSDRGAWRARAFILAMNGDDQGASRIATNMMPPGLAQGLLPFFERLPGLGPTDRAFAVHFGELRPTPERIADARMIPALAPLTPEPGIATPAVVAVVQAQPKAPQDDRRNRRKKRGKQDAVQVATVPPPQVQPQAPPLPQPPVYVASTEPVDQMPYVQPGTVQALARAPEAGRQSMTLAPVTGSRPATVVASTPTVAPERRTPAAEADTRVAAAPTQSEVGRPGSPPPSTSRPVVLASSALPNRPATVAGPPAPSAAETSTRAPESVSQPSDNTPPPAASTAAPTPGAAAPAMAAASTPPPASAPAVTSLPERPVAAAPSPVRSEDSILASIIANISVPGSELVDNPPVETAQADPPPAPVVSAPVRAAPEPVDTAATAREAAAKKAAADKQVLADKKAAETKRMAEAKKLADAKKAAELKKKNDPKVLEPSRIWVQVAGGANEATLPKEWEKVRAKAPAAFKGKSGWTTPLRATNRVLAGPFKTNDEARAFVNALSKEGLSAFTFTSDAGQKVTKLAAK
ncbi:MAG: SPOR domain-containing protein [Sphingomonas sp.]|jgi:tetratricopeptide (TPR) repeat protein|uniref:SPOR domain-containing protein n=1 Tax=Sphingomonas sp. TaxID=28214 RepID=UPI0035644F0B